MTAAEAREYAKKGDISESSPEIVLFYKNVKAHIDLASNTNLHGMKDRPMTYSINLISDMGVAYLEKQGYGFEYVSDPRDGSFYKVTW